MLYYKLIKSVFILLILCSVGFVVSVSAAVKGTATKHESIIKIIHIGDLHGQLEAQQNVRSDNPEGFLQGGLSRVVTQLKKIRVSADKNQQTHFTLMVGDTTHGGVEVSFSQGNAIMGIVNKMAIDVFALGNWDFVYGTCRTHELWNFNDDALALLNAKPQLDCSVLPGGLSATFKTIAANAYVDNNRNSANCPAVGSRVALFDSYKILTDPRNGIKLGIIGFTTERGPRVIGHPVVEGICFTKGDQEIVELVKLMNMKRASGEVDAVIMLSELNIANNRRVIDLVDAAVGAGGIDLVLSADMHEATRLPVYTKNGTPLLSQGFDGQNIGDISLKFKNHQLLDIVIKQWPINEHLAEDPEVAALVEAQIRPFIDGSATNVHFVHGRNLPRAIDNPTTGFGVDTTLAIAGQNINRNNFTNERNAAIFEGTGHSMITDGMRESVIKILRNKLAAGELDAATDAADLCQQFTAAGQCVDFYPVISVIRGFRYGTSVRQGTPITLKDLYDFMPIGALASVGLVSGAQIRGKGVNNNAHRNAGGMEHSAFSSLTPNVRNWGGGWLFNWSGLKYDLNPYADKDNYTANVQVGSDSDGYVALEDSSNYIIVGFGFDKMLYGIESPVPELQFINKPFKTRFVTPTVFRVVYATNTKSTLDSTNSLDLSASDFRAISGSAKSMPVVDLVARYLLDDYLNKNRTFTINKPDSRVSLLCELPDMVHVHDTENGLILDALYPLIDIKIPIMQSLFGGNKNLIQYLDNTAQNACSANGVLF